MASQILNQGERGEQADRTGPPEPARVVLGDGLVGVPPSDAEEAGADLEEALVPDVRGGLTPAQMVERKLRALLHGGNPGLSMQATGRVDDPSERSRRGGPPEGGPS
jgi:hypothetical protein